MGAGLVGKSNSQGRLHLESPFLWDEGGIVKEPSLCLTFESFPWVAAFPRELFNPHTPHPARQIRFLLAHPFSLSEEARSLNEVRSFWRDLSRCVILDFFSKDACHFAIFWWKKKFPQIVLEIYEIKGRTKAISVKILSDRSLWLRKVRGTAFLWWSCVIQLVLPTGSWLRRQLSWAIQVCPLDFYFYLPKILWR